MINSRNLIYTNILDLTRCQNSYVDCRKSNVGTNQGYYIR